MDADIIDGFLFASPKCVACGEPLRIENAWMADGCPCNCVLGTNNGNETRWRLLMQLQQKQLCALEQAALKAEAWERNANDFREESGRIRRTVKVPTDAEERCLVRAEVFDWCAKELKNAIAKVG